MKSKRSPIIYAYSAGMGIYFNASSDGEIECTYNVKNAIEFTAKKLGKEYTGSIHNTIDNYEYLIEFGMYIQRQFDRINKEIFNK